MKYSDNTVYDVDLRRYQHTWNSDGQCTCCGLDGAKWSYWRLETLEGLASNARIPVCKNVK